MAACLPAVDAVAAIAAADEKATLHLFICTYKHTYRGLTALKSMFTMALFTKDVQLNCDEQLTILKADNTTQLSGLGHLASGLGHLAKWPKDHLAKWC